MLASLMTEIRTYTVPASSNTVPASSTVLLCFPAKGGRKDRERGPFLPSTLVMEWQAVGLPGQKLECFLGQKHLTIAHLLIQTPPGKDSDRDKS